MKKVIFTFKTYSLDDLDNVQIIIQIFSNSTFEEKKNYVLKKIILNDRIMSKIPFLVVNFDETDA